MGWEGNVITGLPAYTTERYSTFLAFINRNLPVKIRRMFDLVWPLVFHLSHNHLLKAHHGQGGLPQQCSGKQPACNAGDKGDAVQFLDWEGLLEKGTATHSSILARKIPWREESARLQSILSQRAGHNWATENAGMDRISSRYLRFSIEQTRGSHRLEEGEGLTNKTLWVVRKGLWGEELAPNLGLEIACHFQTGEKIHQRE